MMETLNKPLLNNTVRILCLISVAVILIISRAVYGADLLNLLIFLAFVVFYMQLPGQLIMKILDFRPRHISSFLCIGFFTGWAFVILQYFITELINTNILLYAVGPLCSAIYMIQTYREGSEGNHYRFDPQKLSTAMMIFVLVAFLFSMLKNQLDYLDPSIDELTCLNADRGFHMGLINTLSHGFPMESPWMSGTTYYYHIFTEMMMSVPARIFGLPSDQLLLSCGPYLTTYAFATPLYAVFREMTAKPQRAGLYCVALIMSNIFLARGIKQSIAFLFVFGNENVTGYATGCALTFLICLKYWYDDLVSGRKSWKLLILLLGLMMLVTGIKGPFGLTLLAGIWGTLAIGIIMRKVPLKALLPIVIMSAAFILIYVYVLGSKGQSGVGESPFGLAKILGITFFKAPLTAWMKAHGIPLMARYLVLIVTFVIFMLTAFFLPFTAGYIRELFLVFTGRKEYYFPRVLVYATFLAGFFAMMVLRFHGRSQIYFGFISLFCAVLIAIWFLEDMENNKGVLMKIVRGVFVVSLILCSVGLASYLMDRVDDARASANPANADSRYMSISKDEYVAMRWIKDNTPEDSLLATDRYYSVDPSTYDVVNRWDNRFFLYSDYSNRMCYIEGSGYTLPSAQWKKREERIEINKRFYDPKDAERGKLAKKLGIDYVIVSKDFSHIGDLSNDSYKLCYSNDDIDVYQIK